MKHKSLIIKNRFFISIFFVLFTTPFFAMTQDIQQTEDTLWRITAEEVVITANRYENKILNTGSSIGTLRIDELKALPAFGISNTLQYLPGVYAASTDGMGLNPQITLRGFYGGGEADYVTMLIDGIPVNDIENGMANWNLLPAGSISRIELLRGGSSPLYGDAAMGGVLNIITDKSDKKFLNGSIGYGMFNSSTVGLNFGGKMGKGFYEIYGNNDHTSGFRDHSQWNSATFGGKARLPLSANTTFSLNLYNQLSDIQEPGVLTQNALEEDRVQSLPFFDNDRKKLNKHVVNLAFRNKINKTTDADVSITYQHKTSEQTRTYLQNPLDLTMIFEDGQPVFIPNGDGYYDTTALFGDTKLKKLQTNQAGLAIRILHDNPFHFLKIAGGLEVDYGDYDNKLYDRISGFESIYLSNPELFDTLNTQGSGYRFKTAAYASGEILLFDPLSLIGGFRYDVIADDFTGKFPDPDTTISKVNQAFSPKIALNLVTGEGRDYSGNIYLSYSHAFKAPTVEQMTEFKTLYNSAFIASPYGNFWQIIPLPPFANSNLKPQKSKNIEIGLQQFKKLGQRLIAKIMLVGYKTDVDDEIDFDLTTYQYSNLLKTSHTGLETSLKIGYREAWSGFVVVNYCEAKFRSGENEDKFLKGQPNTSYRFGLAYAKEKGFGATLLLSGAGGIWLDDENTKRLDPFTVLSTRMNYKVGFSTFYLDIENILDSKYSTTGYLQNGQKFVFPSVGRFVRAGMLFNL